MPKKEWVTRDTPKLNFRHTQYRYKDLDEMILITH
jgi:hypothetical protein